MKYGTEDFQKGASLTSVLVAIGLLGAFSIALTKTMKNAFDGSSRVANDYDLLFIKRIALNSSCEESVVASCSNGSLVNLYSKTGATRKVVFSADSSNVTRVNKWVARAECNSNGGITLRAARLKIGKSLTSTNPDDFYPDPLTGKVQTWKNPKTLLFGKTEFCSKSSSSSSSATTAPTTAGSDPFNGPIIGGERIQVIAKRKKDTGTASKTVSGFKHCYLAGHRSYCKRCSDGKGERTYHECQAIPLDPLSDHRWQLNAITKNSDGWAITHCNFICIHP